MLGTYEKRPGVGIESGLIIIKESMYTGRRSVSLPLLAGKVVVYLKSLAGQIIKFDYAANRYVTIFTSQNVM